ncbi:outer membrane beta-barrel domain-containing protein [Haliangium sp.]|uniref:outer membrane beta-barrel domain-containing protein n=1 Tax=Haliangium sp. TaxID=2663208 RepID=UPI003D102DB6
MKRRLCRVVFAASAGLCVLALAGGVAVAQQEEDEGIVFEEDPVQDDGQQADPDIEMGEGDPDVEMGEGDPDIEMEGGQPDLEADLAALDESEDSEAAAAQLSAETRVSWQDIVVVVRKPFLKLRRIEVMPITGITMNDNLIQHIQFGGSLNYYLTDVLSVGLEGFAYVKNLRDPFDLVAFQARRLPAVNQYNYSAALNFGYVPVYGKFAVLDDYIIHWEAALSGGVGFTQSEVIPRNPALEPFTNFLITPNVGASMRFFLTKFLTLNVGVRDYIFIDKFEAAGRTEFDGDAAKDQAVSALINNVMFQAGVSFWWPMSFEYTTFR